MVKKMGTVVLEERSTEKFRKPNQWNRTQPFFSRHWKRGRGHTSEVLPSQKSHPGKGKKKAVKIQAESAPEEVEGGRKVYLKLLRTKKIRNQLRSEVAVCTRGPVKNFGGVKLPV